MKTQQFQALLEEIKTNQTRLISAYEAAYEAQTQQDYEMAQELIDECEELIGEAQYQLRAKAFEVKEQELFADDSDYEEQRIRY